jgi:hypothetical protein
MPIQSGSFIFDSASYGELLDNDPPRLRTCKDFITFPKPFATTPTVIVSLNRVDSDNGQHLRITAGTDTVNVKGFELLATTWYDTRIYSVGISWIAYTD